MDNLDPYELRKMFAEARTSRELILKGDWRPDYSAEELKEYYVHKLAESVRAKGGLDGKGDPELVLRMIDHGLIEPRPCSTKELWSAVIFPLTLRGLRAIIMCEQGFETAARLSEFYRESRTPDWPLERKIAAILTEYARYNWITLKAKKRTYSLGDAINNDILFIVENPGPQETIKLPDDDVPMFRLSYEPPKQHKDPLV